MSLEIERKFLVINDDWRPAVHSTVHIADHLIAQFDGGKMRIRFCRRSSTLTIKGARRGVMRSEYHIPLSDTDAEAIIGEFSDGPALEKQRHEVDVHGLCWQVDEYQGPLRGLVTADVELPDPDFPVAIPDWAGPEITGDMTFASRRLADAITTGPVAVSGILDTYRTMAASVSEGR
ncbi:CYTH domain-containing protein [Rhizobium sp. BK418]|uniref:CYTH domain-containing protein n=1 Tax=Rhizobium sp. BK418 TaxID=2512120 RepID=UPI00104B5E18|nr:CYTH domain-containing protein [Rhizobium sp. BK418]TCS05372.1 CYTH domain-containing protein [Rhizobium sp. BK418]